MGRKRKLPAGMADGQCPPSIRVSMMIDTHRHAEIGQMYMEMFEHFSDVVIDALNLYAYIRRETGEDNFVRISAKLGALGLASGVATPARLASQSVVAPTPSASIGERAPIKSVGVVVSEKPVITNEGDPLSRDDADISSDTARSLLDMSARF